ncbi:hypothetical protein [Flavobacterium flavigenum]|uniref:hypothetical protein n=1 Tax=Flavobacterium flavigenum TaxID=3003258 RepID=UPI0022AC39AE|nr:hypothetical protein [Flavobacterium flavigenum]
MNENNNDLIWTSENLVMFGMWLVKKGEHGYGLLCIHGSCLGLKIGTLLKLKWNDFIEEYNEECKFYLEIVDDKKSKIDTYRLSKFLMRYTKWAYKNDFNDENRTIESLIYINCKTGKSLTTSSLNRELNKFYQEFRSEVYSTTFLDLKLRELKTNSFEIAWARDFVTKYNCTKKAFIIVSKHMGHRTVNDTINLLEIEPNDDIVITYDLFNPSTKEESEIEQIFSNKEKLKQYLLSQNISTTTLEFMKLRDKSKDE